MTKQEAILAELQQRFGPDAESVAKLRKFNEEQTDWEGRCSVCNAVVRGTLAQIREHKHG